LAAHAQHLLTHGILHLIGHDHDGAAAADVMERLEIDILARRGIDNPYAADAADAADAGDAGDAGDANRDLHRAINGERA
jgi:probable rRNA maturation factor